MSNQFSNFASLTFEYGQQKGFTLSNSATPILKDSATVRKTSLGNSYFSGSDIFYSISITNNNSSTITNIKINENMGAYSSSISTSKNSFFPLDYTDLAYFYINGTFDSEIKPKNNFGKIIFEINEIAPFSNILILYKAKINNKAPLDINSSITNTTTVTANEIINPIESSCTIYTNKKADVHIIKYMYPKTILSGEIINYNFIIYNYGNTTATNVTLNDTFSPAPINLNINVNSKTLPKKDYSYINNTLTIPSYGSDFSISIPPAKFFQNSETGIFTVNPGITTITASGKI